MFPGSGIEIVSLNSPKLQSSISGFLNCKDIVNIVSKHNNLGELKLSENKNKF